MPRSRLPSPPSSGGSKGSRPLPPAPEPDGEAPPPLPARPPGPGAPRGLPPPPSSRAPTQDDSSDEEEQATYEEPAERQPTPPPAPPPSRKPQAAVVPEPIGSGEIYDDLDEVIPADGTGEETYEAPDENQTWQQETYDECEIKVAKPAPPSQQPVIQEELYEEPPPQEEEELIQETEYEFVPQSDTPSPPPPPRVLPPPPGQPSLPARPPPSRKDSTEQSPELPNRTGMDSPAAGKKQSSGAAPGIGISLGDLTGAKGRLKKVSSEEKKEPSEGSDGSLGSQSDDSFKGRMEMFKKAEAMSPMSTKTFFNKPALPVKPSVISNASKSKLGTPPPPPGKQLSSSTTSPPPQVNGSAFKPVGRTQKPDSLPPPPPPEPEEVFEEDAIYDEGISFKPPPPDPLGEFPWYHYDSDRHDSDSKLNGIGQDGTFLVRKSQRGGDTQPYTLVVLYKGHVYNLKVRKRPDSQVALGEEKSDELAFKDVPALITYHRNNDVVLVNTKEKKQYKTLLTKFPSYT